MTKTVVLFQYRLLHYREALYERLRSACAQRGVRLELVVGQASRRESVKKDEGALSWAHKVRNRFWEVGERDVLWQPFPAALRGADMAIVMQESRILSNYVLIARRALGLGPKLAYWGHGKNFQSTAPNGLRERWKRLMITRADWWFAYTEMSVALVRQSGYPLERITCLNNAIDTNGFRRDLAGCGEEELQQMRSQLGLVPGAPVGLFCGSLYPDKRLDLLIDAVDRVRAAMPGFSLLVIGDGPSMPVMREAAKTRPWLHLLGVQKGHGKAMYFRLADVMLNPGLVGLHIVDAFCSGLVMFTTRTAMHSPEVAYLRDGVNGVYADDTAEGFSRAVLDVISSPERLQTMRQAALADADTYSLDAMVERFANGIAQAVQA